MSFNYRLQYREARSLNNWQAGSIDISVFSRDFQLFLTRLCPSSCSSRHLVSQLSRAVPARPSSAPRNSFLCPRGGFLAGKIEFFEGLEGPVIDQLCETSKCRLGWFTRVSVWVWTSLCGPAVFVIEIFSRWD